jgi:3-methyladenine DNA glycosylase Mpg
VIGHRRLPCSPRRRRAAFLHDAQAFKRFKRAMGITLEDNQRPLTRGVLTIRDQGIAQGEIVWSPRIGIRVGTQQLWRAAVKGHRSVSGSRPAG